MILSRISIAWFAITVVGVAAPRSSLATISAVLDAGYLRQDATTALPASTGTGGALLLLIAAGGGNGTTFTATPSAGQYVAGGDVILGAASFNAQGGTQMTGAASGQETFNNITLNYPSGVSSSAYIELRWYPSITLAQYNSGATPAASTMFGAYNPLVTNSSNNMTLNPDGNNLWSLPSDGTSIRLNMYTTDTSSGTQVPSEGYANFMVPAAAVPEPSAGILASLTLVMMVGLRRTCRKLGVFGMEEK